jgi:hypothetical protein
MSANEIPDDFLNILRQTFRKGEVAITVEEVPDETDYLFSSSANKYDLLEAIAAEKQGTCYRTITMEEAESFAR